MRVDCTWFIVRETKQHPLFKILLMLMGPFTVSNFVCDLWTAYITHQFNGILLMNAVNVVR